jgi:hypothetical protein
MKTDRELLEAAARAAGYEWGTQDDLDDQTELYLFPLDSEGRYTVWNPLVDDGDALRLAVKLGMDVHVDENLTECTFATTAPLDSVFAAHIGDAYAATRRAIVRGAASMTPNVK